MQKIGYVLCALGLTAAGALLILHPSPGHAEGPQPPAPIVVSPKLPAPQIDGATGLIPVNYAAHYAWNTFLALNWPAASGKRDIADTTANFGSAATPVWETMRSKVELYPGNGSATIGPHGAVVDPTTHKATNSSTDYGYDQAPDYIYAPGKAVTKGGLVTAGPVSRPGRIAGGVGTSDGHIPACSGQQPVTTPAWIPLDETTQIGNNQTYAGVVPAVDPTGRNSKPQLIRYAVKMNRMVYDQVAANGYWYSGKGSLLNEAEANYTKALASGLSQNPATPFVNFAPVADPDPNHSGIELKMSWRPLTAKEAQSGRFFISTVRYYESLPDGQPCYREAKWGLVGMHVITFTSTAPWVIWSTFEQADNILSAKGKPMEDVNGRAIAGPLAYATSPKLSSDPNQIHPVVTKAGDYCKDPGARLFFRENGNKGTQPADGDICVNHRWRPIPGGIIAANAEAHKAIAAYLASHGGGTSPWLYYKLINAQGIPVDYDARDAGTFSTESSYYLANATIETDYSLGNFTGDLVDHVPSNLTSSGQTYYNTQLLPFQTGRFSSLQKERMGGCSGCHGFAASQGADFSFALGDNVERPEPVDAFKRNMFRVYFPPR